MGLFHETDESIVTWAWAFQSISTLQKFLHDFHSYNGQKMQRITEQCCAIKILVKNEKTASENLEMLKAAYEETALSSAWVFRWH